MLLIEEGGLALLVLITMGMLVAAWVGWRVGDRWQL